MTIALLLKELCSGTVGRNPKFQFPIKQGHYGVGRGYKKVLILIAKKRRRIMKRLVSYLTIIAVVFCHSAILSKQVFDPTPAPDPELRKMQAFQVREEGSIRYFGRGRLERRDAGLVLHLKGNHYEMGYQQGILLKDIIRDNVRKNLGRVDPNMEMVEMRLNQMPSELLKELKGIAAGSGVDFKYLFGTNILQHTRSKSSGCSKVFHSWASSYPEMFVYLQEQITRWFRWE